MTNTTSHLKVEAFDVYMVYGFIATPNGNEEVFEKWFDETLEQLTISGSTDRSGWTPMYRLPGGADSVLQVALPFSGTNHENLKIAPPRTWNRDESSGQVLASLSYCYALNRSGAGALTVRMSCTKEGQTGRICNTSDILSLLLLAPRTEYGLPFGESEAKQGFDWQRELSRLSYGVNGGRDLDAILLDEWRMDERLQENVSLPALDADSRFSPAFKLFMLGMTRMINHLRDTGSNFLLRWGEFRPGNEAVETKGCGSTSAMYRNAMRDPQIPYFYVVATVPDNTYFESFAERPDIGVDFVATRRLRSRFTKDISAILNRWLVDRNIPYASCDQLEREGMTVDGAFLSNYMNSLLFTAFSGTAALTLKPADPEENCGLPFEPAIHSILHFVEFSRMRWHQGISINRALDDLISVARFAKARDLVDPMKRLSEQRLKVARYMQNPITYRWDATVGSAVARYIQQQVIGELEEATRRKLDLVKQLLIDRVDIIKSEATLAALAQR